MLVAAVEEHVGDEPPGLLPPVRVVDKVGVDWPVSLAEAVPDAEVLGAQNAGGEFDALYTVFHNSCPASKKNQTFCNTLDYFQY